MSLIQALRAQYPQYAQYSDEELSNFLAPAALASPQAIEPAPELNDSWQITKGLKAGIDQTQALGYGLLGAAGDAMGADALRDYGVEGYQRNMEEAQVNAPNVAGFTDISGVGEALDWASYTLGNLAPTMATALAGGGVGGLVGKKLAQTAATNLMKQQLAKGVSREVAVKTAGELIAKRVAAGQGLGAYAASSGMETGSIYGETGDAGVSFAHGAVAGAFDALPIARVLGKFGLSGAAKDQVQRSVMKEIAKQGGLEAGTEALQTLVEQHAKHWVDTNGQSLLGNLGEANWKEIADAAAAGALGGGVMGGGVGLLTRKPMDDAQAKIQAAGEQAAAAGGDALDQEIAKAHTATQEIPKAAEAETAQQQTRADRMAGIDGMIITAGRMGFTDEEVLLRRAKALFQQADVARERGNHDMASRFAERGNRLYQSVTEASEPLRSESSNYPVPHVAQGEVTGGDLVPSNNPNWVPGQDDISGQATVIPTPQTALPNNSAPRLPPGTEQINMGRDRPERTFTPTGPVTEGIGRNVVERQAQAAPGLPQGNAARTITQAQLMDMHSLRKEGLRTKLRDRTPQQVEAIQAVAAVQAGDLQVVADAQTKPENLSTSPEPVQETPESIQNIAAEPDANMEAKIKANMRPRIDIAGEPIDNEWSSFTPESGTLNVPRAQMPQVKAEHRGALVNYLNARGIEHEKIDIDPAQLKPTQREFSPTKVQKAREYEGGERSILVSSDGHVVDGHHQWMAKRETGEPMNVIQLKAPISDLVPLLHDFPSSEVAGGSTQAAPVGTSQAPAREAPPAKKAPKKNAYHRQPDAEKDDLLTAISLLGGINRTHAEGVDPADFGRRIGIRYLFPKSGGSSIDEMAENLEQYGYVTGSQRAFDLQAKLDAALRGETVLTPEAQIRRLEQMDYDDLMVEAAASMDEVNAQLASEFNLGGPEPESQLQAEWVNKAREAGVDTFDIEEITFWAATEADVIAQLQEKIHAKRPPQDTAAGRLAGQAQPEENTAAAPAGYGSTARPTDPAGEGQDDFLSSYTEADLRARAERDARAEREAETARKAAEAKAQADSEANDFSLSGSNRPADIAASQGQEDIFAPSNDRQMTQAAQDEATSNPLIPDTNVLSKMSPAQAAGEVLSSPYFDGDGKDERYIRNKAETIQAVDDDEIQERAFYKMIDRIDDLMESRGDLIAPPIQDSTLAALVTGKPVPSKPAETLETKETESGTALYSRADDTGPAIALEDAQRIAGDIVSGWKNAPDTVVVQSESGLPSDLQQYIKEDGASGQIDGAFHKGKVYLIADNIKSEADLQRILFHEALGHYGLRQIYGGTLELHLDQLWKRIGGLEGIKRLQKQYGFKLDSYWDSADSWDRGQRQRMMVDELIAHIAGTGKVEPTLMQKIVHLIRQGLNKLFGKRFDTLSDVELLRIVAAARNAVTEGESTVTYLTHDPVFVNMFHRAMYERKGSSEGEEARYSRTTTADQFSDLDEDQASFLNKIGPKTTAQKLRDRVSGVMDNIGLKTRQGMVDRYASLLELDKKAQGDDVVENRTKFSSWVLSKMSHAADGALSAMLAHGRIQLSDGVIELKEGDSQGLMDVLKQLGSTEEIERFLGWIAANRSQSIMEKAREARGRADAAKVEKANLQSMLKEPNLSPAQTRQINKGIKDADAVIKREMDSAAVDERLFTPQEVEAGIKLNQGKTKQNKPRGLVYAKVFKEFQQHRDDVLAIAEQAGIITADNRQMWRDEFYVPFYRVMEEEGIKGPRISKGLSRQEAYKRLKGGTQEVNDLLENTLMNFQHLLSASLKNNAARQALANAEAVGVAERTTEADRNKKASTYILDQGEQVWYDINDELVYESLTALTDIGSNTLSRKIMRSFKRTFTSFTTISPQFVVANTIRDSLQAIAIGNMSYNAFSNVIKGAKAYGAPGNKGRVRGDMLASGAAFSFGHIYGAGDIDALKSGIQRQIKGAHNISSPKDVPHLWRAVWDKYTGYGDTMENANRAAIYEQNMDKGKLYAAFQSRDLMDFSSQGAWPAVKFLTDVVPFLNARLVGLDRLYRGGIKPSFNVIKHMLGGAEVSMTDRQAAQRFGIVVGALTAATIALYMANMDDDRFKELEDWERDAYWHIWVGDKHFTIPKPFEIGAISTVAERALEQAVDDTKDGKLFAERLGHILTDTFAFNPIPQAAKPLFDLYANKDSFTGRDIESLSMLRLSPEFRASARTTDLARWISTITGSTTGKISDQMVISPVQVDFLIQGYLGWAGSLAASTVDVISKSAQGVETPHKKWHEYQPVRRFFRDDSAPKGFTRYGTAFYDHLRDVSMVYADIQNLRKLGEMEEAAELLQENRSKLRYRQLLNKAQRRLSTISSQIKLTQMNRGLGAEAKRQRIDVLTLQRNLITKRVVERLEGDQ